MATATRVVRVANPRRGKFRMRSSGKRRNPARRRRMTARQIKYFGTARQRAGLKASRSRKRSTAKAKTRKRSNPRVKIVYRTRNKRTTHRRKRNPGLIVTLGSVLNPKRRKSVARKTRRRRNARRRRATTVVRHRRARTTRRRANPRRRRRVAVAAPRRRRRMNSRRRTRVHNRRRRRNPSVFGRTGGKDLLMMGAGVLAGVTVTKMIPKYIPASIVNSVGGGNIMAVLISAVSAWVTGYALGKVNKEFGEAAMLGGMAQTFSVALNAFLPSVGGTFSLGDLVNGNFVVPQNPLRGGAYMGPVSAPARGMAAAYGSAY